MFYIFIMGLLRQNSRTIVVQSVNHACSTPGFPVLHHLPELAQTHVHWVGDAIQPSHPLSPSSPPCPQSFPASGSFPNSQFFASSGQNIGASVSVLPTNTQGWFPLGLTGLLVLLSKGLWRVFSSATIRRHQFFGAQPSLWSNSHIHNMTYWKNHSFDYTDFCFQSDVSAF